MLPSKTRLGFLKPVPCPILGDKKPQCRSSLSDSASESPVNAGRVLLPTAPAVNQLLQVLCAITDSLNPSIVVSAVLSGPPFQQAFQRTRRDTNGTQNVRKCFFKFF